MPSERVVGAVSGRVSHAGGDEGGGGGGGASAVIHALLHPRSIAVIGASAVPNSFGERAARHLRRLGYAGEVVLVNPRYPDIAGQPCYPSVAAAPGPVEVAVVLVNAQSAAAAVADAASRGCRAAVVLGTGFGEAGEAGGALQDELLRTARRHGVRLVGPNTNGLVNVAARVPLGFSSVCERPALLSGELAVLAQSGSVAASIADAAMERGIGVSYVLGVGNALDLGVPDFLEYLADDAATRTVFAFIEGIRDPERFLAAVARVTGAGKTLILQKVGRSAAGRALAATHSGSIAGSWEAFRALAEDRGALMVEGLDEALEYCAAAQLRFVDAEAGTRANAVDATDHRVTADTAAAVGVIGPADRVDVAAGHPPRLAVITMSGALSGVYVDEAQRAGLPVPDLDDAAARAELEEMGFHAPFIPLDFGAATGGAPRKPDFRRVCELLLASSAHDGLLIVSGLTHNLANMGKVLTELSATTRKPIAAFAVGGAVVAPFVATLRAAGLTVFATLPQALQGLARIAAARERAASAAAAHAGAGPSRAADPVASSLLDRAVESPDEFNLAALLEHHGLRYPPRQLAASVEEAVSAAAALGYPVALKIVGPRVLHKTVAGLIRLPLTDAAAVRAAWDACRAAAEAQGVWAGHAMLQSLVDLRGGVELIAAVRRDVEVGPILMLGIGGAVAEAVGTAAIAALPRQRADVERLIASHPALRKLLVEERRGLDRDGCVSAVLALATVARAALDRLGTIEVNPVVVLPDGRGVWGLDASAVPADAARH